MKITETRPLSGFAASPVCTAPSLDSREGGIRAAGDTFAAGRHVRPRPLPGALESGSDGTRHATQAMQSGAPTESGRAPALVDLQGVHLVVAKGQVHALQIDQGGRPAGLCRGATLHRLGSVACAIAA